MAPLLAIRLGLCCLLTSVVNGVRDSTVLFEEEFEDIPNVDRITCIRQDNLDLVVPPSPSYIMRQIIGIGATTAQDIMVVATGIQLDFSAKLEIFRHDATRFRFELTGKHSHEGHDDVIAVNFGLEGLEVITQSTMMDWAASLVTNRDVLAGHQTGYLYLKMSGEAEAVWSEEAKQWKVKLFEQKVEPFSIHITSQWILTEALTRAGGIDQIIAKELWPMIQKTIPPSLGAAFNYVPKEDLWYNLKGTIEGKMAAMNSPLTLSCQFGVSGEVSPTKMLQVFLELFDLKEMAANRVTELLASPALRSLWVQNKQAFVETLIHYGLVLGDDFIDTARATKDLEELREPMIKAAKSAADGLVKVLQPFVKALSKGKKGFFDGFQLNSLLKIAWGEDTNGKIRGFESTPGTSRVVVPAEFLGALGATAAIVPPEAGNMKLEFTGLHVDEEKADMAQAVMEQVQLSIGSETHPDVWKVDGSFGNFQLRFPTPVVDGLDMSAEHVVLTMDTSGTITLDTGDGWGFEFDDERGERTSAGITRSGDAKKADGRLPDQFARPSEVVPRLRRTDLIPTFNIESAVTVNDGGQERSQRLSVETTIQINTEVTVIKALPHALAPRSSQDFGYVFYAGQFSWNRISGNAAKKAEDPIIAVVSCGFLRLFTKYIHSGRDLKRIDFTPTAEGGQLELDLSKYTDKLEVAAGSNCVKLVQSGMFPRPAGGLLNWGTVSDELCGQPEDVSKLVEAINLQVARFLDPQASKWNFGTHPADEEAYSLPVNHFTVPLLKVIEQTVTKAAFALVQESDGPSLAQPEVAAPWLDDKEMILTQVETMPLERENLPRATIAVKPSPGALLDRQNNVAQGKPHSSNQREQCRVNQDLAAVYFPPHPKEENQPILRLAIPKLPAIGDLHAVLDNIFFTEVAFKFVIGRKDDNTFSFEITGINEEKAVALAYVNGFEFETPDTMVDNLVKGLENVEQAIGKLKVFGAKHKGRLDKGPLDLHFHMKGDFQNEAVNEWGVVQDSVIHDVKIRFGQGGALQGLVNSAINGLGGIDKIFFDSIWPLVESLIPAALGSAFRAVPASAGSIKFEMEVQGQCSGAIPEKERKCPSQELDVKVESRMVTYGASDTILSGYKASLEAAGEKVPKTLRNMVDAQKSKKVFAHSFIESNIQVAMDKETGLNTDVSMKSALPVGLLFGLAGPAVLDFVPTSGNTMLNGAVELSEGVVHVAGIRIENLKLPLVIKKSDPSAMQMDLSLNSFTAKRMKPVQVGKLDPFSHQAAMSVNAQDLRIQLDEQSGMQLSYNGGNAGQKALVAKPEFLAALLGADPYQAPWSLRKNASERADGAVPSQYKRPAPRFPGVFDLSEVLRKVDASVNMKLLNTGSDEVVHFTVEQQATAKISLSKNVLRGLLDSVDMDYGYIYYTVPGFFGHMNKDALPDARALAVLNCGTLEIYKVSTQASPFEKKFLEASIDLFKDKHDWQLQTLAEEVAGVHSDTCLRVGKSEKMGIKVGEANFFCGRAEPMTALREGILLQRKRFASVDDVAKEYPGSAVAQEALPDGTWFMEFDPYNATTFFPVQRHPRASMVVPPQNIWQDALEYLLRYKPSSKKSWSPMKGLKKKLSKD